MGQEHMTRELTGPQPYRKSLGNTESTAHQSRALLKHSAARGASKPAWANFKPATLRKLVALSSRHATACDKVSGNERKAHQSVINTFKRNVPCFISKS